MNRLLFITFAVYGLIQLALAVPDSESDQNDVDLEKTYPNSPMVLEKPECLSTNPKSLLDNAIYLAEVISTVEYYNIFNPEPIENLQASLVENQPEIIAPVQNLVTVVNAYKDVINLAGDNATERLQFMTAGINFDITIYEFVESKLNDISADQVAEGCKQVQLADKDVKNFNATIEKYKASYTKAVSPNLDEIIEGIKDLSMKYNAAEPDLEATHQQIGKLITVIETETEAINANAEKNLNDFFEHLKAEGVKCDDLMKEYYNKFVEILKV